MLRASAPRPSHACGSRVPPAMRGTTRVNPSAPTRPCVRFLHTPVERYPNIMVVDLSRPPLIKKALFAVPDRDQHHNDRPEIDIHPEQLRSLPLVPHWMNFLHGEIELDLSSVSEHQASMEIPQLLSLEFQRQLAALRSRKPQKYDRFWEEHGDKLIQGYAQGQKINPLLLQMHDRGREEHRHRMIDWLAMASKNPLSVSGIYGKTPEEEIAVKKLQAITAAEYTQLCTDEVMQGVSPGTFKDRTKARGLRAILICLLLLAALYYYFSRGATDRRPATSPVVHQAREPQPPAAQVISIMSSTSSIPKSTQSNEDTEGARTITAAIAAIAAALRTSR